VKIIYIDFGENVGILLKKPARALSFIKKEIRIID
jgi:hypothetical protein